MTWKCSAHWDKKGWLCAVRFQIVTAPVGEEGQWWSDVRILLPLLTWIFAERDGDLGNGCNSVLVWEWCLPGGSPAAWSCGVGRVITLVSDAQATCIQTPLILMCLNFNVFYDVIPLHFYIIDVDTKMTLLKQGTSTDRYPELRSSQTWGGPVHFTWHTAWAEHILSAGPDAYMPCVKGTSHLL